MANFMAPTPFYMAKPVDFSGINSAIDSYSRNAMAQRQMQRDDQRYADSLSLQRDRLAQDKVQADRSYGLDQRRLDQSASQFNQQFGLQKSRDARDQQTFDEDREERGVKRLAPVIDAIQSAPPEQQAALWQQTISKVPTLGQHLKKYGIDANDHSTAVPFLMNEVTGYKTRAQREAEAAGLAHTQAQTGLYNAQASDANAQAAQRRAQASGVGGPYKDAKQLADVEEGLRKEYTTANKDFVTVRDAHRQIDQLSKTGTPASDISLIFSFMKMNDPTSTVREGEYATAQNATGVPGQVVNLYNRMLSGQRLNEEQRADFAAQAKTLFEVRQRGYNDTRKTYEGISKRLSVRPENVLLDLDPAVVPPGSDTQNQQPPPAPEQQQAPQIHPGAVQLLQSNPTPDVIQQFEQKYGPGSARQFLGR